MKPQNKISSYREFWPYYLSEHSKPLTQWLHFLGTLMGIAVGSVLWFEGKHGTGMATGLVIAYGLAWFSHFFIEKNRPATFRYPLWSFISDFRMCFGIIKRLFQPLR